MGEPNPSDAQMVEHLDGQIKELLKEQETDRARIAELEEAELVWHKTIRAERAWIATLEEILAGLVLSAREVEARCDFNWEKIAPDDVARQVRSALKQLRAVAERGSLALTGKGETDG